MYALILAGGKGERLRPLTHTRPKSMAEVLGRPILWYQLQWLKRFGVEDFVLLVGYRWKVVKEYFGDGADLGVRVHYSIEESPLGRGGALRQGLGQVPRGEKLVIALNGDILSGQELPPMIEHHISKGCLATIMTVPLTSPFGTVESDDRGLVTLFLEKPQLPYWINGGVYILDRGMEELLPEQGDHELTTFPKLAMERKLGAFPSFAFWKAIDNLKDLREAEEALPKGPPWLRPE